MKRENAFDLSSGPMFAAIVGWHRPQKHILDVTVAMSMSREWPADVQPELMLWLVAGADQYQRIVVDYVARFVMLGSARMGINANANAQACAVVDAMERVRRRQSSVAAGARAVEFGMRKSSYLALRNFAEDSLLRGIRNALWRFRLVCEGRELPAPRNRQTHLYQHVTENSNVRNFTRADRSSSANDQFTTQGAELAEAA